MLHAPRQRGTTVTKPISTRLHGMIDYSWASAATAMSKRVNGATSTARLLRRAASTATANSLLTNYEAGALRVMPMKAHLAMDVALCGALLAAPLYLPESERRYAFIPMLLGAVGLVTGLLTKTRSPLELDEEFGGVYGGARELSSVADIDPDVAQSPHLRGHLE
jgi:hypothetical protein